MPIVKQNVCRIFETSSCWWRRNGAIVDISFYDENQANLIDETHKRVATLTRAVSAWNLFRTEKRRTLCWWETTKYFSTIRNIIRVNICDNEEPNKCIVFRRFPLAS